MSDISDATQFTVEGYPYCSLVVWWPVFGYEGWYEVSNYGDVRRVKPANNTKVGRLLKPYKTQKGYLGVELRKKWHSVHSLVATAFLGARPENYQINHEDGVKHNNRLDNLEYTTQSGNIRHADALGLRKMPAGENCYKAKLSEQQVIEIRQLLGKISQRELAKMFGVSQGAINGIARNVTWKSI